MRDTEPTAHDSTAPHRDSAWSRPRRDPIVDPWCRDVYLMHAFLLRFPYFLTEHAYRAQFTEFVRAVPFVLSVRVLQLFFAGHALRAAANGALYASLLGRFADSAHFADDASAKLFLASAAVNRAALAAALWIRLIAPDLSNGNVVYSAHEAMSFACFVGVKAYLFAAQFARAAYLHAFADEPALSGWTDFAAHIVLDFVAFVL